MTKEELPDPEKPSEMTLLKHLDFIQALITRMSNSSVQAKSWLLPVVVAAYGYALTQRSGSVALLGIAAVLLFCYIDASYLRQERAYRDLYNTVVEGKVKIPPFSLNPYDVDKSVPDADNDSAATEKDKSVSEKKSYWKEAKIVSQGWFFTEPKVWFSWSIFPFYFGFFLVGCVVLWYAVAH